MIYFLTNNTLIFTLLFLRYANHPSLLGIELLNEPSAPAVPLDVLASFYRRGYEIVRNYSSTAYVIMCQRIGNTDPMELFQANIGVSNIVVDLHYYNLFDPFFNNFNALENIQFIFKSRAPQLQALNSLNGPLVFVGTLTWLKIYFFFTSLEKLITSHKPILFYYPFKSWAN